MAQTLYGQNGIQYLAKGYPQAKNSTLPRSVIWAKYAGAPHEPGGDV
jgi:hypothetical protein